MRGRKISTEAEFDLIFIRDLKHRTKMILRELVKAERGLMKAAKFQKARQGKLSPEEIASAIKFYESLRDQSK